MLFVFKLYWGGYVVNICPGLCVEEVGLRLAAPPLLNAELVSVSLSQQRDWLAIVVRILTAYQAV